LRARGRAHLRTCIRKAAIRGNLVQSPKLNVGCRCTLACVRTCVRTHRARALFADTCRLEGSAPRPFLESSVTNAAISGNLCGSRLRQTSAVDAAECGRAYVRAPPEILYGYRPRRAAWPSFLLWPILDRPFLFFTPTHSRWFRRKMTSPLTDIAATRTA